MPNYDPDGPVHEVPDDATPLGRDATNAAERREALDWCLRNVWANKRIGALERWDDDAWHGWLMWSWKQRT